jgi:hypothetical protein
MNNEVLKFGIDTLTLLLDVINNLTSGSSSFASSLMKVFLAFNTFKIGSKLFNSLLGSIGSIFKQTGLKAG